MDQKQFDAVLSDAETRLRRLKTLYEQWFMGIERVEPAHARKEFEDLLSRMRKEQTNNTAQRFRLQQLVQRHVTLSTHWRRIGRQIEEGTYQRDVQRAKRRKQQELAREVDEPDIDVSYDVDVDEDLAQALAEAERLSAPLGREREARAPAASADPPSPPAAPKLPLGAAGPGVKPGATTDSDAAHSLTPFAMPDSDTQRMRPPRPHKAPPAPPPPLHKQPVMTAGRAPGPPAPPAASGAGTALPARAAGPAGPARPASARRAGNADLSAHDIDRVFQQYVAARGRNAERTDNVKRETIEKTIRAMLPQLRQKHGDKKIDFEVVVKDGRVALKPIAR